jgi:hypothetical protein
MNIGISNALFHDSSLYLLTRERSNVRPSAENARFTQNRVTQSACLSPHARACANSADHQRPLRSNLGGVFEFPLLSVLRSSRLWKAGVHQIMPHDGGARSNVWSTAAINPWSIDAGTGGHAHRNPQMTVSLWCVCCTSTESTASRLSVYKPGVYCVCALPVTKSGTS